MRVLESGHWYACHGPTALSQTGWCLLEKLRQPGDAALLLVDDVHTLATTPKRELANPVIPDFDPNPDYLVRESELRELAWEVLHMLRDPRLISSRRRRARRSSEGGWRCSGFWVTTPTGDDPACVLYDAALCVYKYRLGFTRAVNILPAYFAEEQQRTHRLVRKVLPDFHLETVLYDYENVWRMEESSLVGAV